MKKKDLLLVIDMQNVYTSGQKWACLDTEGAAARINRIIDAGICDNVIFTRFLPADHPTGVWQDYNVVNAEVNADVFANEMLPEFAGALKKYPLYTKNVPCYIR